MARPVKKKGPTFRNNMRDVAYMKPEGYENWMTLTELARHVKKDPSWLRRLERESRIPEALRVEVGSLMVRLWSPAKVTEIETILSKLRPGRPSK